MFFLFIYILFVFLVGMYASRLNRSVIGYVILSLRSPLSFCWCWVQRNHMNRNKQTS